jgi:hypothetical protein
MAILSETALAVAFTKHIALWIIAQPRQEFVCDGGNGIIAVKAFVQGFRLHTSSSFLILCVPL